MLTRLKFALVAVAERAVLAVRRSGLVHVQLDHFWASAMLVRPRALVGVPFNDGVWRGAHMDGRVRRRGMRWVSHGVPHYSLFGRSRQ